MKQRVLWGWILALVMLLAACAPEGISISEQSILLYFGNDKLDGASAESVIVSDELSDQELLTEAMTRLLEGPKSAGNQAVIPEETKLLSAKAGKKRATLDFSSEFYNTESTVEELLCRYTIVRTVCELGIGIESVNILVTGSPLVSKATGEPVGILQPEGMVASLADDNPSTETVILYFANDELLLSEERRLITSKSTDTAEKQIVTELINGPQQDGHIKTLPSETRLLSVETKDGICYVNFSKDFADKLGNMLEEQLKVYAVVNSLCELPQVDKVQILIEGAKVESLNYLFVQEPLERKDSLIRK